MLTPDEAREIAAHWRAQFIDETNFETSWSRYFGMVGDPGRSSLEAWLSKDQAKDAVMNAGIVKTPLLPTQSTYALGDCDHCGGKWFIRKDAPMGHSDFGKAWPCPDCNRGRRMA